MKSGTKWSMHYLLTAKLMCVSTLALVRSQRHILVLSTTSFRKKTTVSGPTQNFTILLMPRKPAFYSYTLERPLPLSLDFTAKLAFHFPLQTYFEVHVGIQSTRAPSFSPSFSPVCQKCILINLERIEQQAKV